MKITWRVWCTLCEEWGHVTSDTTNGQPPKHKGAMPGACPANPSGGNFGHRPIWKEDE